MTDKELVLLELINTLKDLQDVFKHGPGYRKFLVIGDSAYNNKLLSTMFMTASGQGFLHYAVVEDGIERLYILIKRLNHTIS